MDNDGNKVKMVCPKCGEVFNVPAKMAAGTKINGVKCSPCFQKRFTFVNLVLTKFETVRQP